MAQHPIPVALQSAYRDLLDRHLARPEPSMRGRAMRARKGGRAYWVVRRRMGDAMVEAQLGPDTPETAARADAINAQNAALRDWARDASALVAQLRAARMPTPIAGAGKILRAIDVSGAFGRGVVLVGTHAFELYQSELGVRFDEANTRTEDVDVALDRSIRVARAAKGLGAILPGIPLTPLGGPGDPHPVSWRTEDDLTIDLLMQKGRGRRAVDHHPELDVWAQALPYLKFSLQGTIPAVSLYREGVLVRVPAPERYAVHKLIVAGVRTGSWRQKVRKDVAQARALIAALAEDRPYELGAALEDARGRGPKWRGALERTLASEPGLRATLEALA